VKAKIERWLAYGAKIVWDLDPKTESLTVYSPGGEVERLGKVDTLTGGNVLPGFTSALSRVFR
jgi:hypothetical protein